MPRKIDNHLPTPAPAPALQNSSLGILQDLNVYEILFLCDSPLLCCCTLYMNKDKVKFSKIGSIAFPRKTIFIVIIINRKVNTISKSQNESPSLGSLFLKHGYCQNQLFGK